MYLHSNTEHCPYPPFAKPTERLCISNLNHQSSAHKNHAAGFSQSYLFLISIFFSNLFILNLYKQINNSLFLFRILLVCEIFYKLPCGPRTSAAGSQSMSLRFHYKLVLRHIYAVFFCKFNNNARIQIFVRS